MPLSRRRLIALLSALPFAPHALAATPESHALPALPPPQVIPLYDGPAPGSEQWAQQEVYEADGDNHIYRNVTRPQVLAYRPAQPNGMAVMLVPGGAFYFLSMANEGDDTAQKLLARGFTVFLLKYRLIASRKETWHQEADQRLSRPGWEKSLEDEIGAIVLADAQRAMTLVRQRAREFHVAANRIGILGFSAGGYIATRLSLEHSLESRPDFTGCIYGVKPPRLPERVPDLPPLFMAWADDDDLVQPERCALPLYELWKREKVPVEMHIFARGQHGFGSLNYHRPSDHWLELFMEWAESMTGAVAMPRRG